MVRYLIVVFLNIGETSFSGGQVVASISWASLDEKVNQPIEIAKPLLPNKELEEKRYSQAPLMSGYTWFHVVFAKASDNNPVTVFNTGGTQMWPYVQVVSGQTVQFFKQPLAAVRARTHEEIFSQQALKVAVGSLVVLVAFQVIDWILRIVWHIA